MAFNVGSSLTSTVSNAPGPASPAGKRRKFSAEATTQRQNVASSSYGLGFYPIVYHYSLLCRKTTAIDDTTDVFVEIALPPPSDGTTMGNNVVNNDDPLPPLDKKGKHKATK